jgi:hypothetical protein
MSNWNSKPFHPAAGSPSPMNVKSSRMKNNSKKYQTATKVHFHQFILMPLSLVQMTAEAITGKVNRPIKNANITNRVIMIYLLLLGP